MGADLQLHLLFKLKSGNSQSSIMVHGAVRGGTFQMIAMVMSSSLVSLPRIPHLQGSLWVNLDLTETIILRSEHPGGGYLGLVLECILLQAFIKWGPFC